MVGVQEWSAQAVTEILLEKLILFDLIFFYKK